MSFIPADRQVRVFGPSGIVHIPSDHLSVRTIPLYGCMDRIFRYMSMSDQHLQMCVNFLSLMELFHLFRIYLRGVYAMMIEWLYLIFIFIFIATGKSIMLKLFLAQWINYIPMFHKSYFICFNSTELSHYIQVVIFMTFQ